MPEVKSPTLYAGRRPARSPGKTRTPSPSRQQSRDQIVPHRARQATHRTRSSKEAHRPSSDSPLSEVQFRGTGSAFRFDTQPVARFKDRLLLRSTQIEHPLPFVLIELWASPPPTLAV